MTTPAVRLFVAAESPTDHDALCRFLRAQDHLDVLCEVRHASAFDRALEGTRSDVLILNRLLPGADTPDNLLQLALEAMPPRHVIYILPSLPQLAPKVARLHRLGVHTLVGTFGAEVLLESIQRAFRPPRTWHFCAVRPGLGVTTLCVALASLGCVDGERVHLYDAAQRKDLLSLAHLPKGMEAARAGPPETSWGLSVVDWGTSMPEAGEDVYVLTDESFAAKRALSEREKELAPHRQLFSPVGTPAPPGAAWTLPWLPRPPLVGKTPRWNRAQVEPFVPLANKLELLEGGTSREHFRIQAVLPALFQRRRPGRGPR